jgi:putative selenate reductase
MKALASEMGKLGAKTVDEFILKAFGQDDGSGDVNAAAMKNTAIVAEKARNDPRYRYEANKKAPTRINSILVTFDCITCDKCVPVCPNAANFTYPAPKVAFGYRDVIVAADGSFKHADDVKQFAIDQEHQIANYADFCNECGNCDTFCPEYGGPYIKKPGFYSSRETWEAAKPRDGFVVDAASIVGRIQGREYELARENDGNYLYTSDGAAVVISSGDHTVQAAKADADNTRVDMGIYHTLRHLFHGVLDVAGVNQVNAATLVQTTTGS